MTKIINSDVEGFKGKVHFASPLNLEQVFAIEDAKDNAIQVEPSAFLTKLNEVQGNKDERGEAIKAQWSSKADKFFIPALLLCVEKFEITGMEEKPTLQNFPLTPRGKSQQFIDFCWQNLESIYAGEIEVPNAS